VLGLGLLYAAWKPSSLPGRLLISYRPGTTMATIRQVFCGAIGVFLLGFGVILVVVG
jgi:hypothetical protein